jgi:proline dehydrogenase
LKGGNTINAANDHSIEVINAARSLYAMARMVNAKYIYHTSATHNTFTIFEIMNQV